MRKNDNGLPAAPVVPDSAADLFSTQDWERIADALSLSRREAEVAWHIVEGHKLAHAADEMHLAHGTIKTYSERLHRKLHAHNQRDILVSIFRTLLFSRKQDDAL